MSFAAKIAKENRGMKIASTSFSLSQTSANIYMLIQGISEGFPAWYYVSASRVKYPVLQKKCADCTDQLNLTDYCDILYCGWGDDAPPHIKAEMTGKYNFC